MAYNTHKCLIYGELNHPLRTAWTIFSNLPDTVIITKKKQGILRPPAVYTRSLCNYKSGAVFHGQTMMSANQGREDTGKCCRRTREGFPLQQWGRSPKTNSPRGTGHASWATVAPANAAHVCRGQPAAPGLAVIKTGHFPCLDTRLEGLLFIF